MACIAKRFLDSLGLLLCKKKENAAIEERLIGEKEMLRIPPTPADVATVRNQKVCRTQ